MKTQILLLCLICNVIQAIAQTNPVHDYLKASKDHAFIYNGEIEFAYPTNIYENSPYFQSTDFVPGEISFRQKVYPGQKVRLDLYKDQLIVITPKMNLCKVVDTEGVESVTFHGTTFIYNRPTAESKLEKGYYQQLYAGKHLSLLARKTYQCIKIPTDRIVQSKMIQTDYFSYKAKYYIEYNGQYYPVSNKKSFSKIFPAEQKTINRYCKQQKLKFKKGNESPLITLTDYCESLIHQKQ